MKERLITRGQDATKSARFCAQNMAVHLPRGRDASASEAEQELEGDAAEVFIPRIVTGARLSCPYHPECTRVFRNPKTRQDYVRVHHDGRVRRERSTAGMGHSSCGRTDAQRERQRCQRQQARAVLKDIVFEDLRGVSLSLECTLDDAPRGASANHAASRRPWGLVSESHAPGSLLVLASLGRGA